MADGGWRRKSRVDDGGHMKEGKEGHEGSNEVEQKRWGRKEGSIVCEKRRKQGGEVTLRSVTRALAVFWRCLL